MKNCITLSGILIIVFCSCLPLYSQLNFQEYLSQVSKNNLSYIAEQLNVKIAEAEVIAEKVFIDPEIGFEAADETYSINLGYTFELGKRNARINLAKSRAEIEKLALVWFFQELRADAANAFIDVIIQNELLKVKQSSYEYMLKLSTSDSLRFISGEITENELRQSMLEAANLKNEIFQQQGEYKSALVLLNRYLGYKNQNTPEISGNLIDLDISYTLEELLNIGLTNRVDILLAGKSIDLALNELKLVKAERRPDINVSVGYERDWKGVFPYREMLTAGITIPLKFSNINKGAVHAAKYSIEQNELNLKETELQIETEIAEAFYNFEAAKKQVNHYKEGLLHESKKVLDGVVYQYQRGETNIIDVLFAQRTFNEIQQQYLEVLKEYTAALIDLQKNCGIWDITL